MQSEVLEVLQYPPDNMEKVKGPIGCSSNREMMTTRAKGITLAMMVLMSVLAFAMPAGTAAPGLPALSVTVEDVGKVNTDPVEFNHVFVTATVTIENFLLGTTVNVNATTDNYWLVSVSPTTITVDQGQSSKTQDISVDMRVPPKASAVRPVELIVFVNATNYLNLDYEDEARSNFTVRQYHGLRVTTNGTVSVDQAKNITHRMRVTNTGNGQDNLTVVNTNEATLTSNGITLEFPSSVHDVGPDRTTSIVIRVRAEDNAEVGTVEATFKVTSQSDASKSVNYKLTIVIHEATGGNGNGGNGDNGDNGNGDDDGGLLFGFGSIVTVLAFIAIAFVMVTRRMQEDGADDEDYVFGR